MNSGLIPGLLAGPNRLSKAVLSRPQKISEAEANQAFTNLNRQIQFLKNNVVRTSSTTLTATDLERLAVKLQPSSQYRLIYRIFAVGDAGVKIGFQFPSSLPFFSGEATFQAENETDAIVEMSAVWANRYANGYAIIDSGIDDNQTGTLLFTADIYTGSTANTYGDFEALAAQSTSDPESTNILQTSSLETIKYA